VRRGVRDAASLAVGVGVLGYQAAQARAEEARARFRPTISSTPPDLERRVRDARTAAETGARRAWEQLEVLGTEVIERVEPVIARVSDRVEPLLSDLAERVEPVVDKIQERTQSLAHRFAAAQPVADTPARPVS